MIGGPNSASLDVSPSQGEVTFNDQVNSTTFNISISSDDIPENSETFTVRLINPTGGALISSTNNQAQLVIESNDSPVRFASSTIQVMENNETVQLLVYRGDINGNRVGPIDQVTTVYYSTASGIAMAGEDFTATNGMETFEAGSSSVIISIPITDDSMPEGDETFTVTLTGVSNDAVLNAPVTATVIILVNDNAGGIVSFNSTDTQVISEDDQTTATFIVQRMVGSVGDLTVSYSVRDSTNQLATADISVPSGTVTIPNGQNQTSFTVSAVNDMIPEEAEMFTVSIDAIVSGGGELSNETMRVAILYISDSDDVYGVIETVSDSGTITINSVSI